MFNTPGDALNGFLVHPAMPIRSILRSIKHVVQTDALHIIHMQPKVGRT